MKRALAVLLLAVVVCAAPGISQAAKITVTYDWDCDGSTNTTLVTLNSNRTFTTSKGSSGTWGLEPGGGLGWLNYQTGCLPLYSIDLTTGRGVMKCTDGGDFTSNPSCNWIKPFPSRLLSDPAGTETRDESGLPQ